MKENKLTREQLIRRLEGVRFRNGKGDELHILLGGYNTQYGHTRLSELCTYHLREILKHSY